MGWGDRRERTQGHVEEPRPGHLTILEQSIGAERQHTELGHLTNIASHWNRESLERVKKKAICWRLLDLQLSFDCLLQQSLFGFPGFGIQVFEVSNSAMG